MSQVPQAKFIWKINKANKIYRNIPPTYNYFLTISFISST